MVRASGGSPGWPEIVSNECLLSAGHSAVIVCHIVHLHLLPQELSVQLGLLMVSSWLEEEIFQERK